MFGINRELKIHFIGIGGIGMSGIAEVLLKLGYHVSGSDLSKNPNTERLEALGANIYYEHAAKNIKQVQLIVYSSAINEKNPEIIEANNLSLPIIKRAEMLAEIMRLKFGIAVAGSHGKTTTSSFLATILKELDFEPTCIIGGIVKNLSGHALSGAGQYLVAEADESDGSFLFLNPILSVITNIDNDHLDFYKTEENIEKAFEEFANKVPFYGRVALNMNDEKSVKLKKKLRRTYVTFGIKEKAIEECDFTATNIQYTEEGSTFDVECKAEKSSCKISLTGEHNVLNALAAITIAKELKVSLERICKAIEKFTGVGRRFEILHHKKNMVVVDDYGHHPTEVLATIATARSRYPSKKLITIFEPHRYTRTQSFWNEFRDCFKEVDEVYIAPIYAASEEEIEGVTSENLVSDINSLYKNAKLIPNFEKLADIFDEYENENAVILNLGAGSISKEARANLKRWI